MTARNHHFISQCYLKGFVRNRDKPQLFAIDLVTRKSFWPPPAKVGAKRDFNRVEVEGHTPDALERGMAKFEDKLGPALKRIIDARSIDDVEDRILLLNFIALIAIRNPRMRAMMSDFRKRTFKILMDVATSSPDIWAHQVKKATVAGYMRPGTKPDFEKARIFLEEGNYEIKYPREDDIVMEFSVFEPVLMQLWNRNWAVMHAPEQTGGFATSDYPCSLLWSEPGSRQPPGFGLRNTEVLFPVSPSLAVVGTFEDLPPSFTLTESMVATANGNLIAHAERQIYARDDEFRYCLDRELGLMRLGRELSEDVDQVARRQ